MGTPMAHVSKSMMGRQANSHLRSSPSFGFGTEERQKASSAKAGGLTSSPGPVYYPLSTTYNSYPKSPSHSFGAAHRYTKVTSADSSHRTARTGRGDTVPRACPHGSAALGAPQLAPLASSGGVSRPNLLSTPSEKPPSHLRPCLAAAAAHLTAPCGVGRAHPARAGPPHSPLSTPHSPPPTALPPNPSPTALPQALRPTTKTAPRAPRANPCRGWHVLCTTIDSPLGLGLGVGVGVGVGPRAPRANLCRGWHVLCATRRTMLTLPTGAGAWHVLRPQRGERAEGF